MPSYIPALATTNYGDPHPHGIGTRGPAKADPDWLAAFPAPTDKRPALVAERGFSSGVIAGRWYYPTADGWRDTLTDELWRG